MTPAVSYLVEGPSDRPVAERLIGVAGAAPGTAVASGGKSTLDLKVPGLNRAARPHNPWLIIRDLDHDDVDGCLGPCVEQLLGGHPHSPYLVLRLAARSLEAWLLADVDGFTRFFGVARGRVPRHPDEIDSPKEMLASLCRDSTRRDVRDGVAPRPGSGRSFGPRYVEMVVEFTRSTWSVDRARQASPSLNRAIARLSEHVVAWEAEVG